MTYQFKILAVFFSLFLCGVSHTLFAKTSNPFYVRVLLDECDRCENKQWTIRSKRGFVIADPDQLSEKIHTDKKKLSVSVHGSLNLCICVFGH